MKKYYCKLIAIYYNFKLKIKKIKIQRKLGLLYNMPKDILFI